MTAAGKSGALVRALLLVVAIGFLLYATTASWPIVFHPYQHEFREGTPVVQVKTMLNGENPFSLALQASNTYVYGFLYPLLNYPISRAFGATLVNARIMSWLYEWVAALLIFQFAYRRNRSVAMAAFCTVPFFFTDPVKASAQPNELGILLLVATLLIVYQKKFSPFSLALSAIFSVLGFYCKAFFLVGIVYVAGYLFVFLSKRTAVYYFALAMALWVSSLLVVHRIYPAYLNDCLFHHMGVASYTRLHVYEQLEAYRSRNLYLMLVVVGLVVAALRRIRYRRLRIDVTHPDQPLLNGVRANLYFELSALLIFLIFFYKIGGHSGSWGGVYLNLLCSPVLILLVAEKFESFTTPRWLQYVAAIGLVAFMVKNGKLQHEGSQRLPEYAKQISLLERAMASKQQVMNSEFTASIAVAQNREIYESGHSEYFITGNNKYSKFVYGDEIADTNQRYLQDIKRKVESKYFDVILVATAWNLPSSLGTYYEKKTVYSYPGLLDGGGVEFWERK
jgi:hypothetical protein